MRKFGRPTFAGSSGRRYETLFRDEADGALDSERKRMFMQMKREVLRLGGYAREFFVSQTSELTAMADVVIDVARLARSRAGGMSLTELSAPSIGGTVPISLLPLE